MLVVLRSFTYDDISALKKHGHARYSRDEIREMIDTWNSKVYDNSYFEMFAIDNGGELVGYASLYQRSKSIISCGMEVYSEHQKKGYATNAYYKLLDAAKDKGFKIAVAQVRSDNAASIALNKKLGFEAENYEYINKKGNKVFYFIKPL